MYIRYLCYFEGEIIKGFSKNQITLSVFFDFEKAYDRVWRRGVIEELKKIDIKGNMLVFIKNFMDRRSIEVSVGNERSEPKVIENGIPQGSVLSVTLFLVFINNLTQQIKSSVKYSIYADDLAIFITGNNLRKLKNNYQKSINNLISWSHKYGVKFSESKSIAMVFSHSKMQTYPDLFFENNIIKYVQETKFLGMFFDTKLNWKRHIKELKCKAGRNLNILKILSNSNQTLALIEKCY